jgi:hypothetical protein
LQAWEPASCRYPIASTPGQAPGRTAEAEAELQHQALTIQALTIQALPLKRSPRRLQAWEPSCRYPIASTPGQAPGRTAEAEAELQHPALTIQALPQRPPRRLQAWEPASCQNLIASNPGQAPGRTVEAEAEHRLRLKLPLEAGLNRAMPMEISELSSLLTFGADACGRLMPSCGSSTEIRCSTAPLLDDTLADNRRKRSKSGSQQGSWRPVSRQHYGQLPGRGPGVTCVVDGVWGLCPLASHRREFAVYSDH